LREKRERGRRDPEQYMPTVPDAGRLLRCALYRNGGVVSVINALSYSGVMAATVDERLAQTFVELADTLVSGFDLMEFLQLLTERCVELLEVDAAGLLLADERGALQLVAASTEQARLVELFQIQEGPCLESYRTGLTVIITDIGTADASARWPRFAPAAAGMGFANVYAIPMRLRDRVIGTLNLFGPTPDGLDPAVARAARALVDVATIGILQERAAREQELVAGQLQVALNSRVTIEQAKGILAERLQVTPDQAFLMLRQYSRNNNRPLTRLAGDVINGTVSINAPRQARSKPAR
jgi:GAF domain-containing protein